MRWLHCFGSTVEDNFDDAVSSPKYYDKASPAAVDTTDRLSRLRGLLSENKVDYYLVPSSDAHGSEYVADKDRRQRFISGFSGESSMAIIGQADAALFVDGRYHDSAAKEIDENWTLKKVGLPYVPTWQTYLKNLPEGARIGFDGTLFHSEELRSLEVAGVILVQLSENLIDQLWDNRPSLPSTPVFRQDKYAGQSTASKLAELRSFYKGQGAQAYVVHDLAEIAWLLNLRGGDIPFSPVFQAYFISCETSNALFTDESKIDQEVTVYLSDNKVKLRPYNEVWDMLHGFKNSEQQDKVLASKTASFAICEAIGKDRLQQVASPIELWKSLKNETEVKGMKAAYLRDAVAWVTWIARLEKRMKGGKGSELTEWEAAEQLTALRAKNDHFAGLAYENISATGENAALPHYSATRKTAAIISRTSPYLNDSGAQYRDGTIDTTRTYHFGRPTAEQQRAYTRVLQGHIAVAQAKFPAGTTGAPLDALARTPLWSDGMDYKHGTGHGIGSYLNVHEGPSYITSETKEPLRPGQMLSNEPGFYEVGKFGIRIESIYLVVKAKTHRGFGGADNWLALERITQVPIDEAMVDWTLLSSAERLWLRQHNDACARTLLAEVSKSDRQTRKWLKQYRRRRC